MEETPDIPDDVIAGDEARLGRVGSHFIEDIGPGDTIAVVVVVVFLRDTDAVVVEVVVEVCGKVVVGIVDLGTTSGGPGGETLWH